jgi:hypothetical protein
MGNCRQWLGCWRLYVLTLFVCFTASAQELFVTDSSASYDGHLYKVDLDGSKTLLGSGIDIPRAIAINRIGEVFVGNFGGDVVKFEPDGSRSIFISWVGAITSMIFDTNENLFCSGPDVPRHSSYFYAEYAPDGTQLSFSWNSGPMPESQLIYKPDNGDTYSITSDTIFKTTADGTKTVLASGFTNLTAIAYNPAPWGRDVQVLSISPDATTVTTGGSVQFTVVSTALTNGVAWWHNGKVIEGETSPTLTIAAAKLADAGTYSAYSTYARASAVLKVVPPSGKSFLTITTSGGGSVSAPADGKPVNIGSSYTVTAIPAANYLFANWTGSITSSTPTIHFTVTNDMVLQANFVTNQFIEAAGRYEGVTVGIAAPPPAYIALQVNRTGAYSGSVRFPSRVLSFSGKFDPSLNSQPSVLKDGTNNYTLSTTFVSPSNMIANLASPNWQSDLLLRKVAQRSDANAGRYTLIISNQEATGVTSFGAGTAIANQFGSTRYSAKLADDTVVAGSAPFWSDGFPIFKSVYTAGAGIFGWVAPEQDYHWAMWYRSVAPPRASATFTNFPAPATFPYQPPARGTRFIDVENPVLVLSGADLLEPVTNNLALNTYNQIAATSTSLRWLQVTANPTYGTFNGTFSHPVTKAMIRFDGAVNQGAGTGYGHFVSNGKIGSVYFGVPQ